MVTKTRAQDGDSKGKGLDGDDSIEHRFSKMEELNDLRFSRWEEKSDLRFSRLEEKSDQRFSRLEEMIAALGVLRKQTQADQRESFTKSQVIQENDDRSPLDRYSPSSQKVKGSGSEGLERSRGDRRTDESQYGADGRQSRGLMTRMGKVEFPRFDGTDFKGWLFKAEQFFGIDYTPPDVKVQIASIHFDGFASKWHQNFIESDVGLSVLHDWRSYVQFLKDMFEDEDDDPMAELKKLRETEGIRDYHQKFETLRTRLKLPEDYLVSVYLAGLKTETRMHVKMFRPETVRHAYFLGKTYEKAHYQQPVTANWGSRGVSSGVFSKYQKELDNKAEQNTAKVTPKPVNQQARKLSQQEMSDRRSKGLCYFCDEKFTPEHYLVHKKTQLYCMEVEDEFEDVVEVLVEEEKPMPQISATAVSGVTNYKTMRVRGYYDKKLLFILIDSGSTHNFLDPAMAKKLGCVVDVAGLTKVSVADGRQLKVDGKIHKFEWKLQTTTFQSDILLIPLQGVDMVLGVQWLETLGDILWDFKKLDMRFKFQNQKVWLHGIKAGSVRDIKAKKLQKIQEDQVQLTMLCVPKAADNEQGELGTLNAITAESGTESAIDVVLEKFPVAFAEPTELPPFKETHNHKIQLLEGSKPVNQRPCRYAIHQKNESDRIVEDMIKGGTIQPSSSHYASPVVLVEKRQGGAVTKVLVQGLNESVEEATGEFLFDLQKKYPEFVVDNLEVKVLWERGDVIQDHTYE